MARFLARALRFLDSAYEIRGSQVTTDQVDLASVQLVHNVDPVLASGRGIGYEDGWTYAQLGLEADDESGATTPDVWDGLDPYEDGGGTSSSGFPSRIPDSHDLWLYGIGLSERIVTAGSTSTEVNVFLKLPTSMNGIRKQLSATSGGGFFHLARFSANTYLAASGGSFRVGKFTASNVTSGGSFTTIPFPIRIPRDNAGGTLHAFASYSLPGTGGASTLGIETFFHFWLRAIPRGLTPHP